jgi:hypothetical protein
MAGKAGVANSLAVDAVALAFSVAICAVIAWIALEQRRTGQANNFLRLWPIDLLLPSSRRPLMVVSRGTSPIRYWASEGIWIGLGLLMANVAVEAFRAITGT